MALGAIFGALSGLADFGEQRADATQQAADELYRRQLQKQQTQQFQTTQSEQQLRMQELQTRIAQSKNKIPVGNVYTAPGGKQYQRVQDPVSGAFSVEELQGPAAETPEQSMARSLKLLNFSDEEIKTTIERMYGGRAAGLKREVQPDPNSFTGYSAVYIDPTAPPGQQEISREPTMPQRGLIPTETTGTSYDPATGLTSTHTSIRQPLVPGGGGGVPHAAMPLFNVAGAPGGVSAPTPAPNPQTAQGGGAAPPQPGTGNTGPYRGLDENGNIPATAGVPFQIRQAAEDILNGRDVSKMPNRVRLVAESVAKKYGWKGQGSLTPAQQMQITQVDNALTALSDQKNLALFDDPTSILMGGVNLDPKGEGGLQGVTSAIERKLIPQQYATYLNELTRLRGVITGIRSFTGANNSNATADRLLAELPTFSNTKNSRDAFDKLYRLRQEVSIIKHLGYFLDDAQADAIKGPPPESKAAPATSDDEFLQNVTATPPQPR